MAEYKTIIYRDTDSQNTLFIIKEFIYETFGIKCPLLTSEHRSFSEEEKTLVREILNELVSSGAYEITDEEIESYLRLCYANNRAVDRLNNWLRDYEKDHFKTKETIRYYCCRYYSNKVTINPMAPKDIKNIEFNIAHNRYKQIHQEEGRRLNQKDVKQIIDNYKEGHDDLYVIANCEKCGRETIFVLKDNSRTGYCESCNNNQFFEDNTLFESKDYGLAIKKLYDINSKKTIHVATDKEIIFRYRGEPYSVARNQSLFALVYRNSDAKAFFRKEGDRVYFNDDFIAYIKAINPRKGQQIISDLDSLQSDTNYPLDENAALYWLYHTFEFAMASCKESARSMIFTDLGTINTVDEFLNRFLIGSFGEQAYLLSLLNKPYIRYFFEAEEDFARESDETFAFSKLVYKLKKMYVYIASSYNGVSKVVIYEPTKFFNDLLKNDNHNEDRSVIIENLIKEETSYFLEKEFEYFIDYKKKTNDGYDLNCYFNMLYQGDGYYRYLDLVIPLNQEAATTYLKDVIANAYLYNKYQELDTIVSIFKKDFLDGDNTQDIKRVFNRYLSDYTKDNILQTYLNINKETGSGLESVLISFHGSIKTIYELALIAIKNNILHEFSANKEIKTICEALIANYADVERRARESFKKLEDDINKITEDY